MKMSPRSHIREAHPDDKYCSLVFLTKHGDSTMMAGNDPVYTVSCIRGAIGRYWGCNIIQSLSVKIDAMSELNSVQYCQAQYQLAS